MTEQQDISFDPVELEKQPVVPIPEKLLENPNVDDWLRLAEKMLRRESPKLREFALECKKVIEGESYWDRQARLKYKRLELWG